MSKPTARILALALPVLVATGCQAYDRAAYLALVDAREVTRDGTASDVGAPRDVAVDDAPSAPDAARDDATLDGAQGEDAAAFDVTGQDVPGLDVAIADVASIDVPSMDVPSTDVPATDAAIRDVATDVASADTGGCATSCPTDRICCAGACVDRLNDPDRCGACDRACPHTACSGGSCTSACLLGYADCNRNIVRDGCETNLAADPNNCGACATVCALPHAVAACSGGQCAIGTCDAGYADCNDNPADGCEVALASTADHCGACGTRCATPANAIATCLGGTCGFRCAPGFGDCTTAAGCESNLSTATTCGTCTTRCMGATPVCSGMAGAYACTNGCSPATPVRCGSSCVDTALDVNNCGGCATACPRPSNGSATCATGRCGFACDAGFHACGGACVSDTSPATCGTACTPCPAPASGAATCGPTGCGFACDAGCAADTATGTCVCNPPAPRPLAPSSSSIVTSTRPTLRWALAAATDGAQIRLCRDRALTAGCSTVDVVGSSGRPPGGLAAGVWFWQLRGRAGTSLGTSVSATWQFTAPTRTTTVDAHWGSILDPNGDGFADVIVGAPAASVTATALGLAQVYFGSAAGLGATPTSLLAAYDSTGASVACAGDRDGDGLVDMIAGGPDSASASIYNGRTSGLGTSYRSAIMGESRLGAAVASGGDWNRDGYSDTLVGQPSVFSNQGAVVTWYGGGFSFPSIVGPDGPGGFFGAAVAGAGDFNGDGYADVLVGAPGIGANTGRAYTFHGSDSGLATSASVVLNAPSGANGRFGAAVAVAGDVNGDGYSDAVVGAPDAMGLAGSIHVYYGSPAGLAATPATSIVAPADCARFGSSVSWAGDVNGDGFFDIVVGAAGTTTAQGRAFVFTGSPAGLATTPYVTLTEPGTTNFGIAVGGLGSINGDGLDDIIVGASNDSSSRGAAYVYISAASFPTTATTTLNGPASGALFGISVAQLFPGWRPRHTPWTLGVPSGS